MCTLAQMFSRESGPSPGSAGLMMRGGSASPFLTNAWMGNHDAMRSTVGTTEDLTFLPRFGPGFYDWLPKVRTVLDAFSEQQMPGLETHQAPCSRASSPSWGSMRASPESSPGSSDVQSRSRQHSYSNSDSLLDDGETSTDSQTTSSHSQEQLGKCGGGLDLPFWSTNWEDLDQIFLGPDSLGEMLTDPIAPCHLINEDSAAARADSQILEPQHDVMDIENFHKSQILEHQAQHQHQPPTSDYDVLISGTGNPEALMVEHCENSADFLQQQQQQQKHVCENSADFLLLQQDLERGELQSEPQPQEAAGLYLMQLLLGCAQAVEIGDYEMGRQMLSRLTGMASPVGDVMQRIAFYFGKALAEQIHMMTDVTYIHTSAGSSLPKSTEAFSPSTLASHVAYQAYYQVLPYGKFAHLTATQAILEAVGSDERIHVVDLDIGQGLQWPSFLQALSVQNSRCHLKITGVGPDYDLLQQTGRRLCDCAAHHRVTLEYHAVVETHLENLDAGVLRVHLGESLAINCANVLNRSLGSHRLRALERVLHMVKSLNPVVVAVVEVESNDNLSSFQGRFVEALQHYSALFDCLEATLGRSSSERLQIEEIQFASSIRNILAQDRSQGMVRHFRTESWQMCFRQAGFKDSALSGYALYQAKLLLGLYNGEYKFTGEGAALSLGWQDTPVVSVSVWTC